MVCRWTLENKSVWRHQIKWDIFFNSREVVWWLGSMNNNDNKEYSNLQCIFHLKLTHLFLPTKDSTCIHFFSSRQCEQRCSSTWPKTFSNFNFAHFSLPKKIEIDNKSLRKSMSGLINIAIQLKLYSKLELISELKLVPVFLKKRVLVHA